MVLSPSWSPRDPLTECGGERGRTACSGSNCTVKHIVDQRLYTCTLALSPTRSGSGQQTMVRDHGYAASCMDPYPSPGVPPVAAATVHSARKE